MPRSLPGSYQVPDRRSNPYLSPNIMFWMEFTTDRDFEYVDKSLYQTPYKNVVNFFSLFLAADTVKMEKVR